MGAPDTEGITTTAGAEVEPAHSEPDPPWDEGRPEPEPQPDKLSALLEQRREGEIQDYNAALAKAVRARAKSVDDPGWAATFLRFADSFGLKHDFSDATRDLYNGAALDMDEINGTEAGWTLPLASTYIVDQAGMIRHAVVAADWRVRPDPNDTLERLKQTIAAQ